MKGLFNMKYLPEGYIIDSPENQSSMLSPNSLAEALKEERILEARAIVCDHDHNIIVDLKCMKGLIPREEGALGIKEGTVRDIAIISRVNRPVCFIIKEFVRDPQGNLTAILSRREAQEKCMKNYVNKLIPGDIINAKVTHIEQFGVFADIGCGIISLLPIDLISVSRINHPSERYCVGMNIKAVVKSSENGRITLSQKELLGSWQENADNFSPGETVAGVIRSIENYGIFVELTPNLAGLAEFKENVSSGQQASVYIKSIIPQRMKIKLIIIETFDHKYKPSAPKYYINYNHIDKFTYSPPGSNKIIESSFI